MLKGNTYAPIIIFTVVEVARTFAVESVRYHINKGGYVKVDIDIPLSLSAIVELNKGDQVRFFFVIFCFLFLIMFFKINSLFIIQIWVEARGWLFHKSYLNGFQLA